MKYIWLVLLAASQYATAYALKNDAAVQWMRESWMFAYPAGLHVSILCGMLMHKSLSMILDDECSKAVDPRMAGFVYAMGTFAWLCVVLEVAFTVAADASKH